MAVAYGSVGFEVTLLTAIGQHLESKGIGKWTGAPTSTDVALTIDALPATPDRAIAMSLYPVRDEGGTDSVVGLQLRFRGQAGNRSAVKNTIDQVFDALHGMNGTQLGGIPIVLIERRSGAYLGTDGNNRSEHTNNYYLTLTRTGTHRED
jgi:hypothetical protein